MIAVWIWFLAFGAMNGLADGDAGQAGALLRYGVGGRALGMGRVYSAVSEDASSVVLNPAGLVGAKRMEFTSMYSNLYYDSRLAQFGWVLPRPFESLKNPMLRFLLGPSASCGFNWVGLSMTGFEQRSDMGERLGNFNFSENAFLFAWAREEAGQWGLFRYGINVKSVNQNYPGMSIISPTETDGGKRDWSWGMDLGVSFQPIHAPLLRVFSLKYLVPLRMGFVVQNAVQPNWNTTSAEDRFPRFLRGGFSYRLVLRDWIPASWNSVLRWVGRGQIQTAVDWEWNRGSSTGIYFGMEGMIPVSRTGMVFYPRIGSNNQTDGTSLGIGFALPFTSSAQVQMDYAYGFHPYLSNDSRFFLTVKMGKDRGVGFFKKQLEKAYAKQKTEHGWLLRQVAEYPVPDAHLAAQQLSMLEDDSVLIRRYFDLIGGINLANSLFRDAIELMKQSKLERAKEKAIDAVKEFTPLFNQRDKVPLSDRDLMNYGESLILAGRHSDAVLVLQTVVQPTIRSHFLSAVGNQYLRQWDNSLVSYKNAVNEGAETARESMSETALNPQSMVGLSYLGIGELLIQKRDYSEALKWLNRLIQEFPDSLDFNYPRYPVFPDQNIVDDAQFLKGFCHLRLKEYNESVVSMLEIGRFYSRYDYGQITEKMETQFIEILEKQDWQTFGNIAEGLYVEYVETH